MSQNNNATSGGVGFLGFLGLIFIALKLMDYIDWSWWWVLLPLYAVPVLVLSFLSICGLVAIILALLEKK